MVTIIFKCNYCGCENCSDVKVDIYKVVYVTCQSCGKDEDVAHFDRLIERY